MLESSVLAGVMAIPERPVAPDYRTILESYRTGNKDAIPRCSWRSASCTKVERLSQQSEGRTLEYVIQPSPEVAERAYRAAVERSPSRTGHGCDWEEFSRFKEGPTRRSTSNRNVRSRLDGDFTYLRDGAS